MTLTDSQLEYIVTHFAQVHNIDDLDALTRFCLLTGGKADYEAVRAYRTAMGLDLSEGERRALTNAVNDLVQEGVCVYYAGQANLLTANMAVRGYRGKAVGDSLLGITYRIE